MLLFFSALTIIITLPTVVVLVKQLGVSCAGILLIVVLCVWLSVLFFLNLRQSHHSQQYKSMSFVEAPLSLWTSVVLYVIDGTQKTSTWRFFFIPQGFSKTLCYFLWPRDYPFFLQEEEKRDLSASCDCIKFIFGTKLCFFFSFLITSSFPAGEFIGNFKMFAPFAPRKCFFTD